MKWIKNREKFLNEAKIRDVIFPKQAKEVASKWSEKFLDYEEVEPTDKIKQGKWMLEEEDKNKVLSAFFDCDMEHVFSIFKNLPDKFAFITNQSVDTSLISNEKHKAVLNNFDIKSPTVDQMVVLFDNVFKKLDLNATRATEMIQRDENGRPVRDEEGNMIKVQKEAGDPIFSTNLVNINSFLADYNRCFPDEQVSSETFNDRDINSIRNLARDQYNSEYKADFEIFNRDIYLSISHNPKDILNMSISKFYSSCQHLYGGGYRSQLLGNVFDPNSIPAFLIFETPIFWENDKISEFLPLSRMIVRNLETFDDDSNSEPRIFFDRAYPDRMKDIFGDIVEKYSGNKENTSSNDTYYYTPDIDMSDDNIDQPYMDRIRLTKKPYIGVNTRTLHLNRSYDWSQVKVSPKAKIKELVIETPDIPENLLEIDIQLEWIKFKYLSLNTLDGFDKIKTDSVAFDKCKFKNENLVELLKSNEGIKRLQIISCDANNLDFNSFGDLEELHLIYTLDSLNELKTAISNTNLSKLVISGDLISGKEGKSYLSELRRKMKVEIIGPVI